MSALLQISQTPEAYFLNAFVHPFDSGSEVNTITFDAKAAKTAGMKVLA